VCVIVKKEVYIWLAIDRNSRKIVGCFVGDRTQKARKLWASFPEFINNAQLPIQIFGKRTLRLFLTIVIVLLAETGLTNHIER